MKFNVSLDTSQVSQDRTKNSDCSKSKNGYYGMARLRRTVPFWQRRLPAQCRIICWEILDMVVKLSRSDDIFVILMDQTLCDSRWSFFHNDCLLSLTLIVVYDVCINLNTHNDITIGKLTQNTSIVRFISSLTAIHPKFTRESPFLLIPHVNHLKETYGSLNYTGIHYHQYTFVLT